MKASRLLLSCGLDDRYLLQAGSELVLRQFPSLLKLLASRAPIAADLFAEPVLDTEHGLPVRISWYGPTGPVPVAFDQLAPVQLADATAALRERFAAVVPLLEDAVTAALLRGALTLCGRDGLLWSGDRPRASACRTSIEVGSARRLS
jgi:hypothetical protein